MSRSPRRPPSPRPVPWAAAAMVGLLGAGSAPAHAATKRVQVGAPPALAQRLSSGTTVNAFFPAEVTIRAGDAVRFVRTGLQTIDVPPRGGVPLSFTVPSGGSASAADAAGRTFWFRGFDTFILRPQLRVQRFGRTLRFDGRHRVTSGVPGASSPRALTVRFVRKGTFRVASNLHPGMHATVRVVGSAARVPTLAEDRRTVAREVAAATRQAGALARPLPRGVVSVGRVGRGGVERATFAPRALSVARGSVVTFRVPEGAQEGYTVTAGPGDPLVAGTFLGGLARSFERPALDPVATYPSDPPTLGPVRLTRRLHGNGFYNAGVLDGDPDTSTPGEARVRLGEAGTFTFFCLLHRDMRTTVTVRAGD